MAILMLDDNEKVISSELIEIAIPTGSNPGTFNFPDLPNLRNATVTSLEVYAQEQMKHSVNNNATLNFTSAELTDVTLTLEDYGGRQFMQDEPVLGFSGLVVTRGDNRNKSMTGQRVNWPKSFIRLTAASPGTDRAYMMVVRYILAGENLDTKFGEAH